MQLARQTALRLRAKHRPAVSLFSLLGFDLGNERHIRVARLAGLAGLAPPALIFCVMVSGEVRELDRASVFRFPSRTSHPVAVEGECRGQRALAAGGGHEDA